MPTEECMPDYDGCFGIRVSLYAHHTVIVTVTIAVSFSFVLDMGMGRVHGIYVL